MKIKIREEHIKLDTLLKLSGVVGTGGQAKMVIQDGLVFVNGEVCFQRGKKITESDIVSFDGEEITVEADK